jgi:hypothetical protein
MAILIIFSLVLWWAIDRVKKAWERLPCASLVTSMVALAIGLALAFAQNLDLLFALSLTDAPGFVGRIFAGVALMAGSSGINELLDKLGSGMREDST